MSSASQTFPFVLLLVSCIQFGCTFMISVPFAGSSCTLRSGRNSIMQLSMLAKVQPCERPLKLHKSDHLAKQAKSDKVQVLLKSSVDGIGKANQVVQVKSR